MNSNRVRDWWALPLKLVAGRSATQRACSHSCMARYANDSHCQLSFHLFVTDFPISIAYFSDKGALGRILAPPVTAEERLLQQLTKRQVGYAAASAGAAASAVVCPSLPALSLLSFTSNHRPNLSFLYHRFWYILL